MTHRIYKYPLRLDSEQTVVMPQGAHILGVQNQAGALTMWALVQVEAPDVKREICVFGTGHEVPATVRAVALSYVGTVQQGPFIWHVFDNGEAP